MDLLREKIVHEGKNLGNGILKVDGFINHQVDPTLMDACGREFARRFEKVGATKVLTAEISGIAPALMTGLYLGLPVVYARKHKPITMPDQVFLTLSPSHTKGRMVDRADPDRDVRPHRQRTSARELSAPGCGREEAGGVSPHGNVPGSGGAGRRGGGRARPGQVEARSSGRAISRGADRRHARYQATLGPALDSGPGKPGPPRTSDRLSRVVEVH